MRSSLPSLLQYYQKEWDYLREAGERFAKDHPKVARRLHWSGDEPQDPHVARLLESFAFMTAKIQRQNDDLFPTLAHSLLNLLYPSYAEPRPPMGIAQFRPDIEGDAWDAACEIPTKTELTTQAKEGPLCTMKTVYPVHLWPLGVENVDVVLRDQYPRLLPHRFSQRALLRVHLKAQKNPFSRCPLSHIRFYLSGNTQEAGLLHHILLSHKAPIAWHWDGVYHQETADTLRPVGFQDDEESFLTHHPQHPGYRALQDFFTYPEKFLFMDLSTEGLKEFHHDVEVLIGIPDTHPPLKVPIGVHQLSLGCSPMVNLFEGTSEPFRLTHQKNDYVLCPDQTREATTEIISVRDVFRMPEATAQAERIPSYFSCDMNQKDEHTLFWHGRHSLSKRYTGTDYRISFIDTDLNPQDPYHEVIFAQILCSNRHLAHEIPVGGGLQSSASFPLRDVTCVKRPGMTQPPPEDGWVLWSLIRGLAACDLTPHDDKSFRKTWKHLCHIHSHLHATSSLPSMEDAVQGVTLDWSMEPLHHQVWHGFVPTQTIDMTMDTSRSPYVFLLGQVLAKFWHTHSGFQQQFRVKLQSNQGEAWHVWSSPSEG